MTGRDPGLRIGVIAVGRETFDLGRGRHLVAHAVMVLAELDPDLVGTAEPVTEPDHAAAAVRSWPVAPDLVVVLHTTFTDASFVAAIRAETDADLLLWAFPEPRTGGRLRLNSLCGLNLASFWLARHDRACRWLYADPAAPTTPAELAGRVARAAPERPEPLPVAPEAPAVEDRATADRVVAALAETRLGIIGSPPTGFGPCEVDDTALADRFAVEVVRAPLDDLFARADAVPETHLELTGRRTARHVEGLEMMRPDEVEPSLRLAAALAEMAVDDDLDAIAARCWPECFEGGHGALCTPLAVLADGGRPGGCEADALGTLTLLVMQWLGEEPAFLADLVDLDPRDDTGVMWHCGVAPWSMAGADRPRASRHPNRGVPLTHEFTLAPGPVTIARLSSSRDLLRLVVGRGELLERPLPYRGTAGVLRFERPVDEILATIVTEGLEHHYCVARGDHTSALGAIGARLGLPLVPLGLASAPAPI